jgi:hypothetical protein
MSTNMCCSCAQLVHLPCAETVTISALPAKFGTNSICVAKHGGTLNSCSGTDAGTVFTKAHHASTPCDVMEVTSASSIAVGPVMRPISSAVND